MTSIADVICRSGVEGELPFPGVVDAMLTYRV